MTGIIATLGPAIANKKMLLQLHQAGVDMFRFNFAHESYDSAKKVIKMIREIEKEQGIYIKMLLDAEGPGMRTGAIKAKIQYKSGEHFKIYVKSNPQEKKSLWCDYSFLPQDVKIGGIIKIDAGRFQVKVKAKTDAYVEVEALNDFIVVSKRHINLPGVHVHLPSFTGKDKEDMLFAIKEGYAYVALSFVRSAADMHELRTFLNEHGGEKIKTIAKIENQEGIDNIKEIVEASDIVMVARGDLGTELPIENIPIYQMEIIQAAKCANKKVIVATEMLESMMIDITPKRAEVTDVFFAVVCGADYLMLSGETAVGEYPLECTVMMKKIIDSAGKYI